MNSFLFSLDELVIKNKEHVLRIKNVTFSVGNESCAVALIGESGIGKTTIFKSLFPRYVADWSLEPGFRFIANHTFKGVPFTDNEIKKNQIPTIIGFASQLPYFIEEHTARENVFFPLRWAKSNGFDVEEKQAYLEKWELNDIADKPMSILSGGQRQLVNLARALVLRPGVVIIDECFSSMNEEMARHYIAFLSSKYSETCFVVTSHRRTDIEHFNCPILRLNREERGREFVVTAKGESNA
jgi:ABC-type multidrug transport system ATPase subunit